MKGIASYVGPIKGLMDYLKCKLEEKEAEKAEKEYRTRASRFILNSLKGVNK